MNVHLDQLELVLGQQIAGLTAIKNWLPRKLELIKGHRLGELEAFNLREEEQVTRLSQAESQRQVLLGLLARDLELAAPPTLDELTKLVPAPYGERLAAKREQLKALTEHIREGQVLQEELLRVSLEFVHYSMDVFAKLATAAPAAGYGDAGDVAAPAVASWLVNHKA
ncbi:MAG: hypothetical protein JWM80_16 [Cyanobacteria bacterium RYN_339]|nr:hypothetical protein [Cyanobacteria bacterium RYN_339]